MKTSSVRDIVRTFYDEYGWQRDATSMRFVDEVLHVDPDERSQRYLQESELRSAQCFSEGGELFLDAGCGAKPREQLAQKFRTHVCVDVSLVGLQETRKQLGERGWYVVADLAALPFKTGCFDGVLASHCLYHVEKDLQPTVLQELYRVTKTARHLLVFYTSQRNVISVMHRMVKVVIMLARPLVSRSSHERGSGAMAESKNPPPLYAHTYPPKQLARAFPSAEVFCLRMLTNADTAVLRKLRLLDLALPIVGFLERTFPYAMVYLGKYVTIHIRRTTQMSTSIQHA